MKEKIEEAKKYDYKEKLNEKKKQLEDRVIERITSYVKNEMNN